MEQALNDWEGMLRSTIRVRAIAGKYDELLKALKLKAQLEQSDNAEGMSISKPNCPSAELDVISALVSIMSIPKVDDFTPYLCKDYRSQSLMIEINRWLYLAEDYSVDLERVEALI